MVPIPQPPKHWWHHMHYVVLSRVTSLKGLHIGELNAENISVSPHVKNYIQEAKPLTLSYTPLYRVTGHNLKILYNNACSLKKHFNDVKCNYNVLGADIICISETRLKASDMTQHYTIREYIAYQMKKQHKLPPMD